MNDVKRIIIVACVAVVLILFGFWIKGHADVDGWKTAYKYNIAIPAEKADQFNYNVDSHQGLVLTRGDFKTEKGAKFEEMTKDFTYVKRIHEHYTQHTQTYSCGKSTCTRVYYSWDMRGSDEVFAEKTKYFGRDYATNTFDFNSLVEKTNACDITPKDESTGWFDQKKGCKESWDSGYYYVDNNDRYYYKVVPLAFTASFLTDTSEGTVASAFSGRINLENKPIEQMRKDSKGYEAFNNIVLTVLSIILLIGLSFAAYKWVMADGKWSLHE